jgi:hypothetical protein
MANITSLAELKTAIQLLEVEKTYKKQLLRDQLKITYESLRPVNIIKRTLKDITHSGELTNNIIGTASGLASGYLSKKIFIGASGNLLRKLVGSVLQYGVSSIVSKNPEYIKALGLSILQSLFRKKQKIT